MSSDPSPTGVVGGALSKGCLAGLALVWLVAGQARREFLFLLVPAVSFMIIPLTYRQVTGHGYLPPRYYLPNGGAAQMYVRFTDDRP